MKKFIAITEKFDREEIWMLIDAKSEMEATEIAKSDSEVKKVIVCKEVQANNESGISHRFSSLDY